MPKRSRQETTESNSKKVKREVAEVKKEEAEVSSPAKRQLTRIQQLTTSSSSDTDDSSENIVRRPGKPSQLIYTDSSSSDSSTTSSESEEDEKVELKETTKKTENDKCKETDTVKDKDYQSEVPVKSAAHGHQWETKKPPSSSSSETYHSDTEEEDKKRKKKQKQLELKKLTQKNKKNMPKKHNDAKQDLEEGDSDDEAQNNVNDLPEWPQSDYAELIKRIEQQIPEKDTLKFDSRATKLNWEKISFSQYSANECFEVWTGICKRIRRFRILGEILQDAKEWVRQPWTNFYRGSKKNRHPDMPARPLSTYMIYYLKHKDKMCKKFPKLDMTGISRLISEKYNNLPETQRRKYTEMAANERKDFEKKLSDFYRDHPELAHTPKKTPTKNSHSPSKPNSPFKVFLEHLIRKNANADKKTVEEEAKEKWRTLNEKKKAAFINASIKDYDRYQKEVEETKVLYPEFSPPPIRYVLTKEEKLIKEKVAGKPQKPPNSAYSLFSRKMLKSDPDVKSLPPKERMSEISRKWRQLNENEKFKYEEEVRKLQDEYKLEFATYLEGLPDEERVKECNTKKRNSPKKSKTTTSQKKRKETPKKTEANRERHEEQAGTSKKKTVECRPEDRPEEAIELFPGEPKPPPVTPFDIFLQSFHPTRFHSEAARLKKANIAWRDMGSDKHLEFVNKLEDLKKKYVVNFENFLKNLTPAEMSAFHIFKEKKKYEKEFLNGKENADDRDDQDSDEDCSSSDSDSTISSNKSSSSSEDSDS